jgi:hypothetical protein
MIVLVIAMEIILQIAMMRIILDGNGLLMVGIK